MADKAGELVSKFDKVKGRMFSEEDWSILQRLSEAASQTNDEVKVFDISHTGDRFKAQPEESRRPPSSSSTEKGTNEHRKAWMPLTDIVPRSPRT